MMKAVINLQQLKHEVKGTLMMKKLTNVHLQLKSAFQKVDGKKRERPFLMKAMLGQSLLQSMKPADTGEEKKLVVTATVRNLNK